MLDGFVLSHRLAVVQGRRVRIRSFVFERLGPLFWEMELKPASGLVFKNLPEKALGSLRETRLQAMAIEIYLGEIMRRFVKSVDNIERRLLEIILLHRLNRMYARVGVSDPTVKRAVAITGVMFQDRLALLLLDVDTIQHDTIFALDSGNPDKDSEWYMQFLGACALVRVVQALSAVRGATVFLANLSDDADLGIDVFVSLGPKDFAISVKSNFIEQPMTVRSFKNRPVQGFKRDQAVEHGQLIYDGTLLAREVYDILFIPVLAVVGRKGKKMYDLFPYAEDAAAFRELFSEYASGRSIA